MANSDIFVRLLLNTKDFDANLNSTKNSLNRFQKGTADNFNKAKLSVQDFASGIASMAGKFAAGLGMAMGAMEAFEKVMNSSQELGDRYAATMESAKASVDDFFYSLGSGEFSSFLDGMDSIIDRAKKAYQALDQLENTRISFGVRGAEIGANISEAQYLAKNKFAPLDKRLEGFNVWGSNLANLENITKTLQQDLINSITSSVEKEIGSNNVKVSLDDVNKVWDIDLTNEDARKALKERYANSYDGYKARREHLLKERRGTLNEGRIEGINEQLAELDKIYHDAIIVNAMLNKSSVEELKELAALNTEYHTLRGTLKSMGREFNETANEFNNANKGIVGFNPIKSLEGYDVYTGTSEVAKNFTQEVSTKTIEAVEGSLKYLDSKIKEKQDEFANAATDAARIAAQKAINELQKERYEIMVAVKLATTPLSSSSGMEDIKETFKKMAQLPDFKNMKISLPTSQIDSTKQSYDQLGESISNITNLMGAFGSITQGNTENMAQWAASSLQAIAQVIAATSALIPVKKAEANANAEVAVTGAVASAASTPIIGWLTAGAAAAAAIAAISNIPKFAEGGVVGGSSYFGDKILARLNSGELILNQKQQKNLYGLMQPSITRVEVGGQAHISGKDMYITLRNYMESSGNKLPR